MPPTERAQLTLGSPALRVLCADITAMTPGLDQVDAIADALADLLPADHDQYGVLVQRPEEETDHQVRLLDAPGRYAAACIASARLTKGFPVVIIVDTGPQPALRTVMDLSTYDDPILHPRPRPFSGPHCDRCTARARQLAERANRALDAARHAT